MTWWICLLFGHSVSNFHADGDHEHGYYTGRCSRCRRKVVASIFQGWRVDRRPDA